MRTPVSNKTDEVNQTLSRDNAALRFVVEFCGPQAVGATGAIAKPEATNFDTGQPQADLPHTEPNEASKCGVGMCKASAL